MEKNNGTIFLGHTIDYWLELNKRAEDLEITNFIEELAIAYGKIGFYENRIKEMASMLEK